jgi:hypothetical protein
MKDLNQTLEHTEEQIYAQAEARWSATSWHTNARRQLLADSATRGER